MKNVTVKPFGERAVLIEWKPSIDEKTLVKVLQTKQHISNTFSEEILEIVSTYSALAIYLNYGSNVTQFIDSLKNSLKNTSKKESVPRRKVYIPVCYNLEFAPDLEEIAQQKQLTTTQVIEIHTSPVYKVYFLGFLPGFPYLGGLDARLHTPRKKTPRERVASGSVAIGGSQTGVYSTSSPGGWQIIGKTPIPFFSVGKPSPALLKAGDLIKFTSVSKEEFIAIEYQISKDNYQIKKEEVRFA